MKFQGIEPLPDGMPVVAVSTPSGAVDLHNDYLVTAISIDTSDSSVRLSFERTEHVGAVAGRKRPSLTLVMLIFSGVREVQLHGPLRLGADAHGLDFLLFSDRPQEGPIVEVRFDSQSALVVSCRSCSLETGSACVRSLPGGAGESN